VIVPRGAEDVVAGAGAGSDDSGGAAADAEFGRKPETGSVVALANVGDAELELIVDCVDATSEVDVASVPGFKPSSL